MGCAAVPLLVGCGEVKTGSDPDAGNDAAPDAVAEEFCVQADLVTVDRSLADLVATEREIVVGYVDDNDDPHVQAYERDGQVRGLPLRLDDHYGGRLSLFSYDAVSVVASFNHPVRIGWNQVYTATMAWPGGFFTETQPRTPGGIHATNSVVAFNSDRFVLLYRRDVGGSIDVRIEVYDKDWNELSGVNVPAALGMPTGIMATAAGYLVRTNTNRIFAIDTDGNLVSDGIAGDGFAGVTLVGKSPPALPIALRWSGGAVEQLTLNSEGVVQSTDAIIAGRSNITELDALWTESGMVVSWMEGDEVFFVRIVDGERAYPIRRAATAVLALPGIADADARGFILATEKAKDLDSSETVIKRICDEVTGS